MSKASGLMTDITIESASIGPIFNSTHDSRVKEVILQINNIICNNKMEFRQLKYQI